MYSYRYQERRAADNGQAIGGGRAGMNRGCARHPGRSGARSHLICRARD
ncbi:hypothetical protein ppKF707_1036 [Metapseudomonas furukawaii]|uniref:Uncharacterized protein n=1 Tax=Metapseudomonas furukawaii TaxID=1149133 RepID=A0AAD1C1W7_METFU|nr:hypothetical protein ppKF707_1036 [Pseudomonas furukawaii]BAU75275.1 hypothetical protein KF707C_35870 [Pseudomonas furukawaii]